jgi:hypothetical protein
MKAVLVRVGIDKGSGEWLAPVNRDTRRFVYVPIPEDEGNKDGVKLKPIRLGYEENYTQFQKPCEELGRKIRIDSKRLAHLDPDFRCLTYGDEGEKATQLKNANLVGGDLLVFYAAFKPVDSLPNATYDLIYAIIGLFELDGPGRPAENISIDQWHINAHSRRKPQPDDTVWFGKKGQGLSGRLKTCIPIGEWRGGLYRLKDSFFEKWGGMEFPHKKSINDVALQRSGAFPLFKDAEKFYHWFKDQNISLIENNNISDD